MTDKMRWRYGDTNPVIAAVDAATVIEIGDLVYQETDDARPASSQADQNTKEANQELFVTKFLGVAMQRSRAGETAPIRVATTGVFELDCPSGTFELGNLMGANENTAGTALVNQQLVPVAQANRAIGWVAKREAAAVTSVLVDVRSTVMTGGV
ncbi:MAG: hypothetical protein ABSG67_15785 [Thermoguttaceae bacterium]|jgi:hypothetical protein